MRIEGTGHLTIFRDLTGNRNWNIPPCGALPRLVEKQIIAMHVLELFSSCIVYNNKYDVIRLRTQRH